MRNRIASTAHASVVDMLSMNPQLAKDPAQLRDVMEYLVEHNEAFSGCPCPFMFEYPNEMKVCTLHSLRELIINHCQGLFKNDMILRTLADYFSLLREDIDLDRLEENKPIGALIMCMQAVCVLRLTTSHLV